MIYKEVCCRDLEGPFSHHLYIGFSPSNKKAVLDLCTKLQNNGVICYLRSTNDGVKESIRDGVKTSQRCLLFLTPDYINDAWYEGEMLAVVKKSECFSRDMVIILKSADLEVIPEGLREFSTHLFKPEMLNDDTFMVPFMDMITRGMPLLILSFTYFLNMQIHVTLLYSDKDSVKTIQLYRCIQHLHSINVVLGRWGHKPPPLLATSEHGVAQKR